MQSVSRVRNFSVLKNIVMVMGPIQPPIQWVPGALSFGVKPPDHKVHYLPPF
jgi:hypothetical protein